MKIFLIGLPAHGHVNPTLPVVQELRRRGAEVLAYNTEEFRAKLEAAGAEFRLYPPAALSTQSIAQAVTTHLINVTQLVFEASLTLTAFMLAEIEREKPDLLIFDSVCLWGMQAARITQLPAVASITTFVLEQAQVKLTWRDNVGLIGGALPRLPGLLKARWALTQRYGQASLPEKYIFPCRGDINIVYTVRELQPPTPVIDRTFHFVGPSLALPAASTLALPEGPLIYISLGTLHTGNVEFFTACFAAFADFPATFILSAGAQAEALQPPANFIVRAQVPQLEILPRASLFVSHAGINSLHESLYFGVPLVMAPQQLEQMMNARIAAARGVGIVLADRPPYGQRVTAATLRGAVERVLAEPSYRQAAQQLGAALRASGGAAEAVEVIWQLGTRGK